MTAVPLLEFKVDSMDLDMQILGDPIKIPILKRIIHEWVRVPS